MSLTGWFALRQHVTDVQFWAWWVDDRARRQIIWENRNGWWSQYRERGREVD